MAQVELLISLIEKVNISNLIFLLLIGDEIQYNNDWTVSIIIAKVQIVSMEIFV